MYDSQTKIWLFEMYWVDSMKSNQIKQSDADVILYVCMREDVFACGTNFNPHG